MTLRETESAKLRIDGALRNLANTSGNCDVLEDIVAARLFAGVQPTPEIARFRLLGMIGSGGMGTVYAAHDPELDRKVAIKVVRASPGSMESLASARARLTREARILARLSHPNVVTIHETGVHADEVFVVMEFIEGESLGEWASGPRAWTEVVAMYVEAGEGLAAAHALGLVHRDFKPANVLVGRDGRPRVVDFGLARVFDPQQLGTAIDHSLTTPGRVCGTPGYLAPELFTGVRASKQTDLYAYCVALLEALSPAVRSPATGAVPEPIIDALLRGIAPDPAARWASMDELLAELRRASGRTGLGRVNRRWALLALLVLGSAAVLGLVQGW